VVTETDGFVETFTALELERDTLFSAVLLDDFSGNACTFDDRSAYFGGRAIVHEENLAEVDLIISRHRQLIDADCVAFLDAVLFSAGFEDCVGHGKCWLVVWCTMRTPRRAGAGIHHSRRQWARFF